VSPIASDLGRSYWKSGQPTAMAELRRNRRRSSKIWGWVKPVTCGTVVILDKIYWELLKVVSNMTGLFSMIYGRSSETHWLSLHHFSEGWLNHQPENLYSINMY
jgi:hypothetical protein